MNESSRQERIIRTSVVGILVNLLIAAVKIMIGTLASSIALLQILMTTFNSTLKGIGGTNSLANLSNLTTASDITKMTATFGDIHGLLLSLTAITSQIDIVSTMSTNVQSLLGTLANQVNS